MQNVFLNPRVRIADRLTRLTACGPRLDVESVDSPFVLHDVLQLPSKNLEGVGWDLLQDFLQQEPFCFWFLPACFGSSLELRFRIGLETVVGVLLLLSSKVLIV